MPKLGSVRVIGKALMKVSNEGKHRIVFKHDDVFACRDGVRLSVIVFPLTPPGRHPPVSVDAPPPPYTL